MYFIDSKRKWNEYSYHVIFFSMKNKTDSLPKELKSLVNQCVQLLGEVVQEEAGLKLFTDVELIRKEMVSYRNASAANKKKILSDLYLRMDKKTKEQQHQIAIAFSLMLEVINSCETAYRTYRLREDHASQKLSRKKNMLVYVLTAHPTEARTPQNIELFHRIHDVAVRILEESRELDYLLSIIKHNLKLAWLLPITRHEKPEVVDEARHLFSILLRPDIFDTILRANRDLGSVRVRTWVGGDKDGHPGVDEKVMLDCLQASRDHFIILIKRVLKKLDQDIAFLDNKELPSLSEELHELIKQIKIIKKDDFSRVKTLRTFLVKYNKSYQKVVGAQSPRLQKLESVLELFPSLVVPIELREDSEIIAKSLVSKNPLAIERMLRKLREIAG